MTANFRRTPRIFPQKIHPPRTHGSKLAHTAVKTLWKRRLSRRQGWEQGLPLLASEERSIVLLLVLFDQNPCGIDDIGWICGWIALVLLPEIEHSRNFGRLTVGWTDSLRRDFARTSEETRRSRQTSPRRGL